MRESEVIELMKNLNKTQLEVIKETMKIIIENKKSSRFKKI